MLLPLSRISCGYAVKGVGMLLERTGDSVTAHRTQLDRWLRDIGWGLLLTMTGIIWMLPQDRVPEGA
jgi:hypothetical protein